MFNDLDWIKNYNDKICPVLRNEIIKTYTHWKWVPNFLQKTFTIFKHYFAKHDVIIQINEEVFSAVSDINALQNIIGCKVKHKLDHLNSFSTSVNTKTLQKILGNKSITQIWSDREVHISLDVATPVIDAPRVWESKDEGNNIGIAIIDTGIYPHPDLINPLKRIVAFKDFVNGRSAAYDDHGHGTHCAGDAAGNGFKSSGKYKGPAPKANLIGVKVLNKTGSGNTSKVIAGVQWCIDNKNKYGIRIISMSLGSPALQSYKQDPLCKSVRKAWESGIVVCIAAGNDGPRARTIDSPGIEPKVITVGALDDKNTFPIVDDTIASFSSRGPTVDGLNKPDVAAPGVSIISLRDPSSYLDKNNPKTRVDQWYTSLSGTSMATPICAGVAALILSEHPYLTPDEVKNALIKSCHTISSNPNAEGAGLVDAKLAFDYVTH